MLKSGFSLLGDGTKFGCDCGDDEDGGRSCSGEDDTDGLGDSCGIDSGLTEGDTEEDGEEGIWLVLSGAGMIVLRA